MPTAALPTFDDVAAAARRLQGHAHRTPVLRSATADAEFGAELFFKCENFQRMGAFKFRGAFNALSCLDEAQRRAGVVAYSSGNHAQAVALAARTTTRWACTTRCSGRAASPATSCSCRTTWRRASGRWRWTAPATRRTTRRWC